MLNDSEKEIRYKRSVRAFGREENVENVSESEAVLRFMTDKPVSRKDRKRLVPRLGAIPPVLLGSRVCTVIVAVGKLLTSPRAVRQSPKAIIKLSSEKNRSSSRPRNGLWSQSRVRGPGPAVESLRRRFFCRVKLITVLTVNAS